MHFRFGNNERQNRNKIISRHNDCRIFASTPTSRRIVTVTATTIVSIVSMTAIAISLTIHDDRITFNNIAASVALDPQGPRG
jgi:hypothetical protein